MSPQKVSYYLYQYDQYEYRSFQEEVPYGNWKDQKLFQWKCELNNFVEWNSVNQTLRGRVLSIKTELQDEIWHQSQHLRLEKTNEKASMLLPLLVIHPPCWFMSEVHFAASMSNVHKVLGCLVTAGLNPALNGWHSLRSCRESVRGRQRKADASQNQNRLILLFERSFDHFHFYPTYGLILWHQPRLC